ncbi:MAG: tail fiber domain-containing protein [Terriglobales bacterium]|jgi:hypothetical protein
MKTHVAGVILIVLCFGLFAVAQETAKNSSSVAPLAGSADHPPVTYKAVKTAAPYGTANYLPVWTGSNIIANSVVYQSGSDVGIGTTTPAATLDVNGAVNATTTFNLGGTPFAFGAYSIGNAFLGFAGNATMTEGGNTASGFQAFQSNTTGCCNVATGTYALQQNTTGCCNVASGDGALQSNTTGHENTADGTGALQSNTSGLFNVAVGRQALSANTIGYTNTGIGMYALYSNTTGGGNTALGFNANVGSGALANAIAIGANAYVTRSNSLVLGAINGVNNGTSNTNVGIGTTAPTNIFTIGQSFGHAIADGWDTYSSRRWKTNIQTLHGALGKIEHLRGVSYELKDSGKHEIGVVAEEVGAVVPEVVSYEQNGKDARGVDYSRLTALLIEAIKQQQREIRDLKSELRATRQSLQKVKAQVAASQLTVVASK